MIKLLVVVGMFLLILSSGLIIKDWDNGDDVKLMSVDDMDHYVELNPPMDILQTQVLPYQFKEQLKYKEVGNGSSS